MCQTNSHCVTKHERPLHKMQPMSNRRTQLHAWTYIRPQGEPWWIKMVQWNKTLQILIHNMSNSHCGRAVICMSRTLFGKLTGHSTDNTFITHVVHTTIHFMYVCSVICISRTLHGKQTSHNADDTHITCTVHPIINSMWYMQHSTVLQTNQWPQCDTYSTCMADKPVWQTNQWPQRDTYSTCSAYNYTFYVCMFSNMYITHTAWQTNQSQCRWYTNHMHSTSNHKLYVVHATQHSMADKPVTTTWYI